MMPLKNTDLFYFQKWTVLLVCRTVFYGVQTISRREQFVFIIVNVYAPIKAFGLKYIFITSQVKFQFKYDIHLACKVILQDYLDKTGIPYEIIGMGEIRIDGTVSPDQLQHFESYIKRYGIEIVDDPKDAIVQRIKELIKEIVYKEDKLTDSNISAYLADKMNLSYGHLSKLFSEVTYTTIENFMIIQRIERAKQLIIDEKLSCSEVAWKMNYSSVAHLSNQFKKTTGLTPRVFQRIIEKRNNPDLNPSQLPS
jgi:AraC-like DNA-binding protein